MVIKKIGTTLWKVLLYTQRTLMIIAVIATTLLVFIPMVLRELGRPFAGYEEFLLVFAFWLYMMGSSHGSYEKSQITADIMSKVLKGKARMGLNLAASILTCILCIVFTYWALALVQWSIHTGAVSPLHRIPVVIGQSSIFFGMLISSIYCFVYMVRDIRNAYLVLVCKEDIQTIEEQEVLS